MFIIPISRYNPGFVDGRFVELIHLWLGGTNSPKRSSPPSRYEPWLSSDMLVYKPHEYTIDEHPYNVGPQLCFLVFKPQ